MRTIAVFDATGAKDNKAAYRAGNPVSAPALHSRNNDGQHACWRRRAGFAGIIALKKSLDRPPRFRYRPERSRRRIRVMHRNGLASLRASTQDRAA